MSMLNKENAFLDIYEIIRIKTREILKVTASHIVRYRKNLVLTFSLALNFSSFKIIFTISF